MLEMDLRVIQPTSCNHGHISAHYYTLPSFLDHGIFSPQDWRVHLEQMHQHRDGIETSLTETKVHLDKLHDEISHTLEKIGSREKYLNNQLEHLLSEFRMAQDQLAETKEKYRQASGGVTERSRTLAEVREMGEMGSGFMMMKKIMMVVMSDHDD